MAKPQDITGQRFGRWTAVEITAKRHERRACWLVRCDCGNESVVCISYLTRGGSRSCGCLQAEIAGDTIRGVRLSHGQTESPTYAIWGAMKTRCTNRNQKAYPYYGGRGIRVCDRWANSFENFLADMGERPVGLTLERLNNDGDYEPGNVVWANRKRQSRNQRKNTLTEQQVSTIKSLLAEGRRPAAVAAAASASTKDVCQIRSGRVWVGDSVIVFPPSMRT